MENIFKDAYFGKPYKTRNERKFVYLGEVKSLFGHNSAIQGMIEEEDLLTYYNSEGKPLYCEYRGSAINAFNIDFNQVCEEDSEIDIVSEWQEEEISEEELDKLANNYEEEYTKEDYEAIKGTLNYEWSAEIEGKTEGFIDGFKAGFNYKRIRHGKYI